MRRRSRLPILIRLAHLDESRTLQELGRTRQTVERNQKALQRLTEALTATCAGAILAPGRRERACRLAAAADRGRGIRIHSEAVERDLVVARAREDQARAALVGAKLRLRTLRRAAARRRARERMDARRAEIRRMDEIQRGLRPEEEA